MSRYFQTDTRRKQALTLVLVATLGFSLSAPLRHPFESLDLASNEEVRTGRIAHDNGRSYDVRYIRGGDGQTIAVYDVRIEGRDCASQECLATTILNVPFDRDLADIEAALRQRIAQGRDRRGDDIERERGEGTETTAEERRRISDRRALDRLRDGCRQSQNIEKARCLTDRLVDHLRRNKRLDPSVALEFYTTEIRTLIVDLGAIDGGAHDYQRGADMLRGLHARLPSEFNNIREDAVSTALDMVRRAQADIQARATRVTDYETRAAAVRQQADLLNQQANSIQGSNPQQALMLRQQAMTLQNQSMQLTTAAAQLRGQLTHTQSFISGSMIPYLQTQQHYGLQQAMSSGLIDESYASRMMTQFLDGHTALIAGVTALPVVTAPNSTLTLPGTSIVIDNARGTRGNIPSGITFGPTRQFQPSAVGTPPAFGPVRSF